MKFGHYFAADAWFNLGQDSEARFGQDFKFNLDSEILIWSRFV